MLNVMQATKESQDTRKALKAAERALTDFEAASAPWQATGRELDAALRAMGDVENLFEVMQADARALAVRIGKLNSAHKPTERAANGSAEAGDEKSEGPSD